MNVILQHRPDDHPRRTFSVGDVRRMVDAGILDEHERIELIQGDLIMMAAKGFAHEMIKSALLKRISRAASDELVVGAEMTIELADDVLVEPDIAVFSVSDVMQSAAGFVRLRANRLQLLIEVAASSLGYDKNLKATLYAAHGVREYWIIDANERRTWIHTGPQRDSWTSIVERAATATLTTPAVPGFAVRLADIG